MKDFEARDLCQSLSEISAIVDTSAVASVLHAIASRYELRTIAYFATGIGASDQQEPYLAVTYSSDWVDHYKARGYVQIDPVIRLGMRRLLPLEWDQIEKPSGAVKDFFGEASEFGLGHHGLTIPVHGRNGDHALFTITSNSPDAEWRRNKLLYMREFQIIAVHLHDLVLRLEGQSPLLAKLSPRELECLHWAAEGKTAWECGIILGLSEHTVRCYLESARYKLRASSNTHAVSLAHRTGLFAGTL